MATAVTLALRDFLVRYQQLTVRETGHRPLTWLRSPMDEELLLPGCTRPGYACWQPMPWKAGQPAFGKAAETIHPSIIDYLSMCQFLEVRFQLPVAQAGSPLSFLYGRTFETCPNTVLHSPARAFEEAFLYRREHPQLPAAYCMAVTRDDGEPLLIMLRLQDGEVFIHRAMTDGEPLYLKMGIDRFLPKVRFICDC